MRLALECPTSLLKVIQPLADFDFILTHLVLKDEKYAKFYKKSTRYKILDNSTNELLDPCSLEDIEEADKLVGPCNEIVSPDFLGDAEMTLDALDLACTKFGKGRVLPVVQGRDRLETGNCAEAIWNRGFTKMAVPYDILCKRTYSLQTMATQRHSLVAYFESRFCLDLELHLLGMTTLEELQNYKSQASRVVSIDTGGPVLMGLYRHRYGRDPLSPKLTPTQNQMDMCNSSYGEVDIFYNIAYLRKEINHAG